MSLTMSLKRLMSALVGCWWIFNLLPAILLFANDDLPTPSEVRELGLVVHWNAQTERSPTGGGQSGVALWTHSKIRNQVITIKVGDRIVEQINANDVDVSATEKLAQTSNGNSATQRLGIESARALADTIIARYAKIGRKAEKFELDQPVIYLVSASNNGAVQALNGETGESFWSNAVGNYRLPTLGPGINDRFVTVVNGSDLYVFELISGHLLGKHRLSETPSAVPQPIGSLIYVPGITGSLFAYEGEALDAPPVSLRFTGTLTAPVVASSDGRYIAWPNKNHLYIAQSGRKFLLWSKIESSSTFRTMPQPTADGFVAVATSGMVYRMNLRQTESIVWRKNLAAQVSTPPLVARGLVVIVSDVGNGYALDQETGELMWVSNVPDLSQILAITETKVFAQRKAGQLVAIDRSNGKSVANIRRSFAQGVFNNVNDRIILRSLSGTLICLREPASVDPLLNVPMAKKEEVAKAESNAKPAMGLESTTEPPTSSPDSLFGDSVKVDGATMPSNDDPFSPAPSGTTPSSGKPADPFSPF